MTCREMNVRNRARVSGMHHSKNKQGCHVETALLIICKIQNREFYSLLSEVTGFPRAALMAWKLMVRAATAMAATPANRKIQKWMSMR